MPLILPPARPPGGGAVLRHAVRGAAHRHAAGRPGRRHRRVRQPRAEGRAPRGARPRRPRLAAVRALDRRLRHRRPRGLLQHHRRATGHGPGARLAPGLAAAHGVRPGAGAGHRHPGRRDHRLQGRDTGRQGGQRHRVRHAGDPQLRAGSRAGVLRRRRVRVVTGQRIRETERGPGRARQAHDPADGGAGRRAGRGVHAPAAQRHDRHAARGLHHHGEVQGRVAAPGAVAPRPAARPASRFSPWPGSTSGR